LPEKSKQALAYCIKEGGFVKYGQLKDFDDDMDFFWKVGKTLSHNWHTEAKRLLVVEKWFMVRDNSKVAFYTC